MLDGYIVAAMLGFGIIFLFGGLLGLLRASIKPEKLANPHRMRSFSALWMIVGVVLLAGVFVIR